MTSAVIKWRDINSQSVPIAHRVYRSDTPIDKEALPAPIADNIPRDQMHYEDTTVTYGNTYYYLVSAYTELNEEFSDEIIVTVKQSVYMASGTKLYKYGYQQNLKYAALAIEPSAGSNVNCFETDHLGNIYVGTVDSSVVKYDAYGNELWRVTVTASQAKAIAVDPDGNVYVGGGYMLFKYSPLGELVWSVEIPTTDLGTNTRYPVGLAIDKQGSVVVLCMYHTYGAYGGLAKFDNTGNYLFGYNLGMSNSYMGYPRLHLDDQSNIYITLVYTRAWNSTYTYHFKYDAGGTQIYQMAVSRDSVHGRDSVLDHINGRIITFTSSNYVWVTDLDGNDITSTLSNLPNIATNQATIDNDGRLYVVGSGTTEMYVYDSAYNLLGTYPIEVAPSDSTTGMRIDPGKTVIENRLLA